MRLPQSPPLSRPLQAGWLDRANVQRLLILLGVAGVGLVLLNTRLGAYLSDDSYYYIAPVRDALRGEGFHPSYIFAPLFPFALTVLGLLGLEAVVAARWLNAVLFGVNVLLAGRLAQRAGAPPAGAVLAAALVLLSDVLIEAHGWAMSEAISLTFTLLCLDTLLAYCAGGKTRHLWLSAGCAALAVLARYAALPLVAAAALTVWLFGPAKNGLRRFGMSAAYSGLAMLPIAAYWLRNRLVSGSSVRYQQFLYVPVTRDQFDWFFYHWWSLFVPGRLLRGHETLAGVVLTGIMLALAALLVWALAHRWANRAAMGARAGLFALAALILANFGMLFLARGLTELDVFNPRYLVPPLLAALILLGTTAGLAWEAGGRRLRAGIALAATVFLAYYAIRSADFTRTTMRAGLGYANAGWHSSETVAFLRANPQIPEIVSTGEMGIYFWTGRKPTVLSAFGSPERMRAHLCETGGLLLLMDQMPPEIYGMRYETATSGLEQVYNFNDSDVYRCPTGGNQ